MSTERTLDPAPAAAGPTGWRKSSHSAGDNGSCLEVAESGFASRLLVPVRDSKRPGGPALFFPARAWTAFIEGVKG
ncbi:DUF397 domain-containing protein [Streptomyces mauvecolor]|uniref:DUF397 domain-containing protein n=1 Tax=Streptomyces mauvecolor TaxID=58345 RepID=A0ABV9UI12_9ACTN